MGLGGAAGSGERNLLRKFLGSKTPVDWLKISLNLTKKNYAYIFENTPEKLIWKSPDKFLQPKGQGGGRGRGQGQFWSISNHIVKVGVDATG